MPVFALAGERRWECTACGATDVTTEAQPHTRMHNCPALAGLSVPMVPAGTKCKVTAVEREDYVGQEMVQLDGNGRPVMAVNIEREDGNDVAVYAPCALLRIG